MILDNHETIKKSQWQEIATNFGIAYQEDDVIRFLVERIAEKIGLVHESVSDYELRKNVVDKINSLESENAEEPIVEEPIVEEPIAEEPIVEEPIVEEPIVEEPIAEEPIAEEPIAEEPIVEEPIVEQPIVEQPIVEQPIVEEPIAEEPIAEEPIVEQPIVEEPIAEEPIVEEPIVEEPIVEEPIVEEPIAEEPIVEEPISEEPIAEEPIAEEPIVEEPIAEEPIAEELTQLSRLEQLRLECECYGIAWAENHTETNLEQVLDNLKSAGVQPIKDLPNFLNSVEESLDVTQAFEITTENVDNVSSLIEISRLNDPAYNPLSVEQKPVLNGGYNSSSTYLDTFAQMYLNAIRTHFRVLSFNEISEMILRDKQSFTFVINFHPNQANKVEIILTQDNSSVRIPSNDTNDWLEING